MQELQIFKSMEFGQVRTIIIDDEPWFIGKDIALALGYSNTQDALSRHVDLEDKADVAFHDGRQKRTMIGVNESGLYSLIFESKLETAKQFKRWVTSEVLPTLRKDDAYTTNIIHHYPVSPAALEGATKAGRLAERLRKSQGAAPHQIAMVVKDLFQQAGIETLDCFVKIPIYEQLSLDFDVAIR